MNDTQILNSENGGDGLFGLSDSAPIPQPSSARIRARKSFTEEELSFIRREYCRSDLIEMGKTLGRSPNAVSIKAQRMGLQRFKQPSPNSLSRLKQLDPLIILLRDERRRQRLSQRKLGIKAGFHMGTISVWELGVQQPRLTDLRAWAEALGRDITLAETLIKFPSREEMLKRWKGRRA